MPHASGKPGTSFHGYILNVAFWDGSAESLEVLEEKHFWLGPLLAGLESASHLAGMWIGRLPLGWDPYAWTPEEFAKEMELDEWSRF